jgi:ribonuclease VapC
LAVDTSALTAILLGELDSPALLNALAAVPRVGLSVSNPITPDDTLADSAADAYRRFGKGRHPAGLNFGDCFSYALANHEGVPLLFKER